MLYCIYGVSLDTRFSDWCENGRAPTVFEPLQNGPSVRLRAFCVSGFRTVITFLFGYLETLYDLVPEI